MKKIFAFLFFLLFVLSLNLYSQASFQLKFFDGKGFKTINYKLTRPKVALVLSGGGARGLAHIGVLKIFDRYNIPIDCIIGTSMGSIVGGLYCAGLKAEEIERLALETNWEEVLAFGEDRDRSNLFLDRRYLIEKSFIYFRFKGFKPVVPSYIISGQKITESLLKIFFKAPYHYVTDYEDLNPRFYSVATDLRSGRRIIFSTGNLVYAVRASATIPLVFQPVVIDSLVLVDGGLISNIPADIAADLGCDVVITVDATSPLLSAGDIQLPWNTADQIVGIMMQLSNKFQLEKSDMVLRPQLGDVTSSDFNKAKFIIERGEEAAAEKIEEIISLINSKFKFEGEGKIGKISNYRLRLYGDGLPADIISSFDPNHELDDDKLVKMVYELISKREYKKIDVEIHREPEIYDVIVETELNPEIKRVNVFPQSIENFKVDFKRYLPMDLLRLVEVNDSSFVFIPYGQVYNTEKNRREIESEVLKIFRFAGFPFVKVMNFYFDELRGELNIYLSDGYVSGVKILGNSKTRDFVIFRDVMFKVNDILTEHKVIKTLQNLWSTNLFSQIKIGFQVTDSVEVMLDFEEAASRFLRLGIRIDNERGTQFFSDFRDENTFGLNDNIGLTFQGGMRNSILKFEYKVDRFLQTMLTYGLALSYSERKVYTYSKIRGDRSFSLKNEGEIKFISTAAALSVGGQFERLGNTLLKYQLERSSVKNVSRNEFNEERNYLAKLLLNIAVDSRDRIYFPNHGVYLNAFYETSQKFIGSDVPYSKIFFAYENYNTYFKYGTIKFRFLFGLCDESTPLSQQFFLGSVTGLNSFSGMREDEVYGRQIILSGIEVRVKNPMKIIFENFISFRYDVGSAWEKLEAVRWKDLRQGLGIEIGFNTPVGALKISVGKSFIFKSLKSEALLWGQTVFHFLLGFE